MMIHGKHMRENLQLSYELKSKFKQCKGFRGIFVKAIMVYITCTCSAFLLHSSHFSVCYKSSTCNFIAFIQLFHLRDSMKNLIRFLSFPRSFDFISTQKRALVRALSNSNIMWWMKKYSSNDDILVGDGDMSFSLGLAKEFANATKLISITNEYFGFHFCL